MAEGSNTPTDGARIRRGALLAILDQGLFLVGNSCLLLGMARWIPKGTFGLYSNYHILLILVSNLQVSFLLEPTVVLGAGRGPDSQIHYLAETWRICRRTSLLASLALPLVLAPLIWTLQSRAGWGGVAGILLGTGVATWGMLELLVARRALYCAGKVGASAKMALVFVVGLILGLAVLIRIHAMNLGNCLLLQGLLGVAAVKGVGEPALAFGPKEGEWAYPFREHFQYGKVVFASFLLGWLGNLYFPLLSFSQGLESAAILRSALNFVYPSVMMNQALGQFFLPVWANQPSADARRKALYQALAGWALFGGVVWGILAAAPTFLLQLVYRETYLGAAWMLPILGLLPLFDGLTYFLSLALRAANRPKVMLAGTAIMAASVLGVGLPLVLVKGLPGAVGGLVITSVLYCLGMAFMAHRFGDQS